MSTTKSLKIKPYARLLTMLGEQLIKNERIALIELIKNSYDADANWVKISFNNFGDNYEITPQSEIVIEDDGHGMSPDIIENHWLHPATPEKKRRKEKVGTSPKGRLIQGEKGIGRFSILKLGRTVEVITLAEGDNKESIISYDFSKYDDDFLTENKKEKNLFIDDLSVDIETRKATTFIGDITLGTRKIKRKPHGTRITISNLKGTWTDKKVEESYRDIARLQSIFPGTKKAARTKDDFSVFIYKDNDVQNYAERYSEKLGVLLENNAVIKITNGRYEEEKQEFRFELDGVPKVISLRDPEISGLKVFRDRFGSAGKELDERSTQCGSFNFGFYIFDFSPQAPAKFQLDKEDKKIIRDHRIYLYRDGIRVYPYGEPDDDWLRIDAYRGTISAGHFLSNDQVVGFVNISQTENKALKDKTNREGLIEEGNATHDFIALLQTILAYARQKPYARYRADLEDKKVHDIHKTAQVQKDLDELKTAVDGNKKALNLLSKAEKAYKAERDYLTQRAETTEELAGIGLSVETASHDIMAIMHKATTAIDALVSDSMHGDLDEAELAKELQSLRGMLSFIEAQLKDIQLLFKSSKQRRKSIKVKDIIDKVERIYRRLLKAEKIELLITEAGSPLVAKTTDAVLLQLLLNLFDNSVYWLQQMHQSKRTISITLDGTKGEMIFSDNGPGINKDDAPYIFEPFYSGKGEEGRGLGLYIARQLLERNDYSIDLADLKSQKKLSGANFVVSFVSGDK